MIVHYFDGRGTMVYTSCRELPFGPLAVKHTARHEKVTCPTCKLLTPCCFPHWAHKGTAINRLA